MKHWQWKPRILSDDTILGQLDYQVLHGIGVPCYELARSGNVGLPDELVSDCRGSVVIAAR